jgi:hypothetical protein
MPLSNKLLSKLDKVHPKGPICHAAFSLDFFEGIACFRAALKSATISSRSTL